jgi:hypothetical protein
MGVILIGLGVLFLIGQVVDVDWGGFTWPFFVIVPGLAMVAFGLSQRDGSGLTVAGSMVAIVGLLLLYQNMTDHWESWAYAWALVAPGGSGVGMLLYGARSGNAGMTRGGMWQIVTALGIFAVGFVFFEGLIGISGDRLALPEWVMPAAIIGLGVLVLIRAVTSGRERHDEPQAS